MQLNKRVAVAVGLTAAASMIITACGSGGGSGNDNSSASQSNNNGSNRGVAAAFNAATIGFVNKSDKTGGNLNLVSTGDCDAWDPANTYYGWCWNMQRLFTRTLVGYSSFTGANNVGIEPDLATALGEPNADFTQWTCSLKDVFRETGQPVTSKELK